MGDSETDVTQTSTVVDNSTGEYVDGTSKVDATVTAVASENPVDAAYSVGPDSNSAAEVSHADLNVTAEGDNKPVGGEDGNQSTVGDERSMEINQINDYAHSNGVVSEVNGNVAAPTDMQATATEQQFEDVTALSAEEERLWSIVKANSLDFNAWTSLIEETERVAQDNITKIRKVYDAFLAEFPLCYGYWKKYADHEARFGAIDKVVEVYERAVQGVTYSVDMWLHYCVFAINNYGDPDTIRRLFERAVAYVGADYLSFPLWDKYIEFEYTQQQWVNLVMIYTRILENPIQQLDRYFASFKELAGSRPLAELRTAEENSAADAEGTEKEAKEVNADAMDESSKPVSAGVTEAEELEEFIALREEMYKKAKEFDSKIIGYETAIRRPYFHVRPLNDGELENWHNYLDFIETDGDFNKIFRLYERCLVACANYTEFWIRYILYMEAKESLDLADNALARATQVFVKRQPEIHLFAARFKEEHDDVPGARAAYQLVHTEISPGLLEAIINHANMERRLGSVEDAFTLYEQAIAIEKGKEHSQILPMLFAQYSRFVYLVCGNTEKARDILVGALEHVQVSKPLLEALIHLEAIQSLPKRIDYLDSLVDKFLTPGPDNSDAASVLDRDELSSIYMEFLGLFGDVQAIKKAKDRHARLFLRHRSSVESRKRRADDFVTSDKAKLAKSDSAVPSTTASVAGAYPTGQNQWASGYGAQPQSWPAAPQAQGQTYNPGYAQQTAYSGYYGGTYPPQPVVAPVPQTPAYGAYPSTYPAQAYPQQTYQAPMAAAATPAVQQPTAAAPQPYYGYTY